MVIVCVAQGHLLSRLSLVLLCVSGCARTHAMDAAIDGGWHDAGRWDAGLVDSGIDTGVRDATPDALVCVAAPEICNGADDDCDATIDEGEALCAADNADAACTGGACTITACTEGFADCDRAFESGCESDVEASAGTCGVCDHACTEGTACRDGICDDERVVRISAGGFHTCAVRTNGHVVCWGENSSGALGTGDTELRTTPAPVLGATEYVEVNAETASTCGVRRNGTVQCWGANSHGQLGDGTTNPHLTPSDVTGLDDVVAIAGFPALGGNDFVIARRADGSLWGWGNNYYGQLGEPLSPFVGVLTPRPLDFGLFLQHDASGMSGCGIDLTLGLVCWPSGARLWSEGIRTGRRWQRLRTGGPTCAVDDSSALYCWGRNYYGEVGAACSPCDTPQLVPLGAAVIDFDAGTFTACAVVTDGTLYCWGRERFAPDSAGFAPVAAPGIEGAVAVSVSLLRTCALDSRGGVWCWNDAVVGDGTVGAAGFPYTPVRVVDLYPERE